jgi:hypothetical protein
MQYTPSSAKLFQALHILSIVRHNGGVLSPCQLLELVASQWIPIDVPTWDPCTKVIPSSVIYSARKKQLEGLCCHQLLLLFLFSVAACEENTNGNLATALTACGGEKILRYTENYGDSVHSRLSIKQKSLPNLDP